jgi:hypothetical protein
MSARKQTKKMSTITPKSSSKQVDAKVAKAMASVIARATRPGVRAPRVGKPKNKKMKISLVNAAGRPGPPVATSSLSSKPYFRLTSSGDSINVHACDRIPTGVTLSLDLLSVEDVNYSGAVLLKIPLNPSALGERLRRLSSNFELYSFKSMVVHFAPAQGTQNAGSLLGFYDQDPTDEFDAGIRSLAEASAHPQAHSIKIWEDGFWAMPARASGRFYIDRNGSTSADKRLQDQGNFRLMIDVPVPDSLLPSTGDLVLGSVYVEYICELSKPTIQPNFVGTADSMVLSSDGGATAASGFISATTANVLEAFYDAGPRVIPAYDPRSNAGTTFERVVSDAHASIAIPEGVWNVSLSMNYSLDAAGTWRLNHTAAVNQTASHAESNVTDGVTPTRQASDGAANAYFITEAALITDAGFTTGFQLCVPAAEFRYYTFSLTEVSGTSTLTMSNIRITISSVWPNDEQEDVINPEGVPMAKRLLALETKLRRVDEEKVKPVLVSLKQRSIPLPPTRKTPELGSDIDESKQVKHPPDWVPVVHKDGTVDIRPSPDDFYEHFKTLPTPPGETKQQRQAREIQLYEQYYPPSSTIKLNPAQLKAARAQFLKDLKAIGDASDDDSDDFKPTAEEHGRETAVPALLVRSRSVAKLTRT